MVLFFLIAFITVNARIYRVYNEFYKVYNGTSIAFNLGLTKQFKNNLFLGINTNIDYLFKSKDLNNHFGKQYKSYETSLNFGYGKKSDSYFSYAIGIGYNINPGVYLVHDDFGDPIGTIYRQNTFFASLNVNYNLMVYKKLYFYSGLSLKTRVEMYNYWKDAVIETWPEPNWGTFIIPSINLGFNYVL